MEEQSQPRPSSESEPILFRSASSGADAFKLTVYMGVGVFSLSYLLSGRIDGVLGHFAWILILVFSTYLLADGTYNAARKKGDESNGFLVDTEGLVDRCSWNGFGRVYWHEVKAIYPVTLQFFRLSTRLRSIGLDVTESYLARRPRWIRIRIGLNRKVFKAPDLQFSPKDLREPPQWILEVLQTRLQEHEFRSISEAKELESGS